MKYTAFFLLAVGLLFTFCENDPFTEKPVYEFDVQQNSIANHTPIRLVAWSGGKGCSDDKQRYPGYQYVVKNLRTGGQFRILSNESIDKSFFHHKLEYFSYTSKDTSDFLLLRALQHTGGKGRVFNGVVVAGSPAKNRPQPAIKLPETIWSNEKYRAFEQRRYPTVFGTILRVIE